MQDQFGRNVVSVDNGNGTTTYTATDSGSNSVSVTFPNSTPPSQAVASLNAMAPPSFHVPLNQQYTASAYGQLLINQFTESNAQRGLTEAQMFYLAENLGPFYILLQTGALQTFLDELGNIPIDGVVITTSVVSQFQLAIGAYLNGD